MPCGKGVCKSFVIKGPFLRHKLSIEVAYVFICKNVYNLFNVRLSFYFFMQATWQKIDHSIFAN